MDLILKPRNTSCWLLFIYCAFLLSSKTSCFADNCECSVSTSIISNHGRVEPCSTFIKVIASESGQPWADPTKSEYAGQMLTDNSPEARASSASNADQGQTSSNSAVPGQDSDSSTDLGESRSKTADLEQTPNSNIPPMFRLHSLHNEIWSPVKSTSILQGYANQVDPAPATKLLKGGLIFQQNDSTLSTIQHRIKSGFLSGFIQQTPQIDPDVFHELHAQLSHSRPILQAELESAQHDMEAQLARPQARLPAVISEFPQSTRVPVLNSELEAQLHKTKPLISSEMERATLEMNEEIARSKTRLNRYDFRTSFGNGISAPYVPPDISRQVDLQIARSKNEIDTEITLASQQLQAQLGNRISVASPQISSNIKSQIAYAQKQTQASISRAMPELEAVYTKLRQQPQLATQGQLLHPASPVEERASLERLIPWDQWYAKVARAYEPRLLKALEKRGNPAGSNTVSITVWPNNHLEASIAHSSTKSFDAATLEAYKSLDGAPVLDYPIGSHRQKVTFLIDNQHKSSRAISGVNSDTYTGDNEVQVLNNH